MHAYIHACCSLSFIGSFSVFAQAITVDGQTFLFLDTTGETYICRYIGLKVLVCLSNSKQLFHNQTVLMTSHYFDFDAVTHSIKDVSVSTRLSLASSELFQIHG